MPVFHIFNEDYLMHQVVKPYGTSVEVNFRRIEVIANLMQFFPPPSSRGKPATAEQWNEFQDSKKLPSAIKREMKYNLLPDSFHDRFDELESDWTEMSNSKFLAEAQKCEAADSKERTKRNEANKEKKHKKSASTETDDDKSVNLNRNQCNKNSNYHKQKTGGKPSSQNSARVCELCKLAGAPEMVWSSHFTNQCKKRSSYAKSLNNNSNSSSSSRFSSSKKEMRRYEAKL
jgi:hypothetical protein